MGNFWNLVLTFNSAFLACATLFLIYSTGMLLIAFEWQRFLVALVTFLVFVATELAIAGTLHN